MEVILLETVARLGDLGDKVTVKPGYGRNFLIPQKKAVAATPENVKLFAARRAELERVANEKLAEARSRAEQVEALAVIINTRAGEEGKLFGSVTVRDIADNCEKQGVSIGKSEIRLPDGPIRQLGDYDIAIHLHPEVDAVLKLTVAPEA